MSKKATYCGTCKCMVAADANVVVVAGKGKRPATTFHADWQDCEDAMNTSAVRAVRKGTYALRFGHSPSIDLEPAYL